MSRDSRSRTNGNTVRRAPSAPPSAGAWASLRVATRASVSTQDPTQKTAYRSLYGNFRPLIADAWRKLLLRLRQPHSGVGPFRRSQLRIRPQLFGQETNTSPSV